MYSLGDISSVDLVVIRVLVFSIAGLQCIQEGHEVGCGDLEKEEKDNMASRKIWRGEWPRRGEGVGEKWRGKGKKSKMGRQKRDIRKSESKVGSRQGEKQKEREQRGHHRKRESTKCVSERERGKKQGIRKKQE